MVLAQPVLHLLQVKVMLAVALLNQHLLTERVAVEVRALLVLQAQQLKQVMAELVLIQHLQMPSEQQQVWDS
jgi:hypothetical protein